MHVQARASLKEPSRPFTPAHRGMLEVAPPLKALAAVADRRLSVSACCLRPVLERSASLPVVGSAARLAKVGALSYPLLPPDSCLEHMQP